MVRPVLVAILALLLSGGAAPARVHATDEQPGRISTKAVPPMLGISYRAPGGVIAWFDPVTLQPLPGRKARLGGHLGSWAFSSDRSVLAVASCGSDQRLPGIRFVNARAMRVLGDVRLTPYRGCASALTWLRPDRLLAVTSIDASDEREIVVVDPVARRVVRRAEIAAYPAAVGRTEDRLVLLLGSFGAFAPARLAVVDYEGAIRTVSVERVLHGTVAEGGGEDSDYRSRTVEPGLAVDPDGERAYLVPPSGPVAEVDLESLAVSYHDLERPTLLSRLWGWLFPAAEAKVMEGPVREARWVGDGRIAVSGQDYWVTSNGEDEPTVTATPAGVALIDTHTWTVRVLDREASGVATAPGLVVAQGGRWDSGQERGFGPGLRAFGLDGGERWRLHPGEYRWMDPAGPVGYAYFDGDHAEVVDLATGTVLTTVRASERNPFPQLLAAPVSSW